MGAVNAAESEIVVSLDPVALRAAFHQSHSQSEQSEQAQKARTFYLRAATPARVSAAKASTAPGFIINGVQFNLLTTAAVSQWKSYGWHTFRHTFGTFLNANGENPKVIQELLRHATLKVTMDTYVQAVSDEKRNAQSKVVKMLLPGIRRAVN